MLSFVSMVLAGIVILLAPRASCSQPGSLDTSFATGSGANGEIKALAVQPDGKILIGGSFTAFNGTNQNHIARLNADGSLDTSFNFGNGALDVNLIRVLPDEKIFVSGSFSTFDFARLLPDGTLDTNYVPAALTISPQYHSFLVAVQSDGKAIFAISDYYSGFRLARLDENGFRDQTYAEYHYPTDSFDQGGAGLKVRYLCGSVAPNGDLFLGGDFCARIHLSGSIDSDFLIPSASYYSSNYFGIRGFALEEQNVLILQNITNQSGISCSVSSLRPDASFDPNFSRAYGSNSFATSILGFPDGKTIFAGDFTNVNGIARARIARLNPSGSLDNNFDPGTGPNNVIDAVAMASDGKIIIAGQFTSVDGVSCGRIARLNGDDPTPLGFVSNPQNVSVSAGRDASFYVLVKGTGNIRYQWKRDGMELDGATNSSLTLHNIRLADNGAQISVLVRDSETSLESAPATLSVTRAPVTPGSPDPAVWFASANGPVTLLATNEGGKILVAGKFDQIDGTPRHGIAQFNSDGTLDETFDPGAGPDNLIYAIQCQAGGKVLIGGAFTNVDGLQRMCLARLNANGSADPSFAANYFTRSYPAQVDCIFPMPNGTLWVGGGFDEVNGQGRSAQALFSADGVLQPISAPYDPTGPIETTFLQIRQDNTMVRAGMDGSSKPLLEVFRTNSVGTYILSWHGTFPGAAYTYGPPAAIAIQPDGKILAETGGFGLTRFLTNGIVDTNFNPNHYPDIRSLLLEPDGRIITGGAAYHSGALEQDNLMRLNPNGARDTSFPPGTGPDGTVNAMLRLPDGSLLIAGEFARVDGCKRDGLARLNTDVRISKAAFDAGLFSAEVKMDLGKNYYLESSASLSNDWSTVGFREGNGSTQALSDPATSSPKRFYRVRAE